MSNRLNIFFILIIGAGAMLLAGCSREPSIAPPPETRAERLAVLDRIAAECRVPGAMMELVGEDRLRLRPSANEPYERVECVLLRTDRLNLPVGHVDFVGNAAGPPPETNNGVATENEAVAETSNAQAD